MMIYISDSLHNQLSTAPDGALVLGTYSSEHATASVTAIRCPQDAVSSGARQVLARIGDATAVYPFSISQNGATTWIDGSGGLAEVHVYSTADFFKRTPFNDGIMDHLKQERILIVGMGSVGAPMGIELARAGVGGLIAVDKDVLEIHNCMRHVLGTAYVGWPKSVAFKHYVEEHAPACDCTAEYSDVFQDERKRLGELIEETHPTRILAVTDSLRIQYLCQRAALHYRIPLMAVWCDNNAVEGEIFLWEPGQARGWRPGRPERGCYACMRDPDSVSIGRSSTFDYSSDDPDTYGGEPALGAFINRINTIASIMMTAWMLRDCPVTTKLANMLEKPYEGQGLQYVRLGGPYPFEAEGQITAKRSWAVEWYRVLKNHDCTFCSDVEQNAKVLFPERSIPGNDLDAWDDFECL